MALRKDNMCKYCEELNEESCEIRVHEIIIQGGYYFYDVPIHYCPNCGAKLIKGRKGYYEQDDL